MVLLGSFGVLVGVLWEPAQSFGESLNAQRSVHKCAEKCAQVRTLSNDALAVRFERLFREPLSLQIPARILDFGVLAQRLQQAKNKLKN